MPPPAARSRTDDDSPGAIGARFPDAFGRVYPLLARRRKWVALGVYSVFTACAFLGAYLLRFAGDVPDVYGPSLLWGLLLLIPIRVLSHLAFGVTMGRWRYASLIDLGRLVISVTAGSLVFTALSWGAVPVEPRVPVGVLLIEWVLTTYFIAGQWALYRTVYEWVRHGSGHTMHKRVVIVGAGEAGDQLLRELQRAGRGVYDVAGFVDDDPLKIGASIHGVRVLGPVNDLAAIVEGAAADEILVALPSVGPRALRRIVAACQETGLPYRVLPGIAAVLSGSVSLDQLRNVRIEDLLGREPIELKLPSLAADIRGRVVMVTGAAGSIGSELCRQIALHGPACIILFDHAESELYFIERELRDDHPDVRLVPIVGDVCNERDVSLVFSRFAPDRVFHAAAYKHVPLMEVNVRKAIENNVLGTRRLIEACGRSGVEKFVLISTDKAVRPSSVMGATKRAAELLLMRAAREYRDVGWYAVRFGNVLGSAGSVIPLFKKQLGTGKPITVTHEEVTRYFMTIPEAVQLILQASVLDEARDRIAMLDMGQPVRILDLARDLIRLSGRIEGVDAEIQVVGLRPGEKLHEELTAPEEFAVPTRVDRISVLNDPGRDLPDPIEWLLPDGAASLADATDHHLRDSLMRLAAESHAPGRAAADPPVASHIPHDLKYGGVD